MNGEFDTPFVGANAVYDSPFITTTPLAVAVTSQTIDGQNVTISGTTTGDPTSGSGSLTVSGNPGATQGPATLTLGAGTFTITFTGVPAGLQFTPNISVLSSDGAMATATGTPFTIPGVSGSPEAPSATTMVSSDLAASYVVHEFVSADLAATYSVASSTSLVSADLVGSYNIESSITLVSADLEAAYAVNARVSADLEAMYAVFQAPTTSLVSADLEASYRVFAYVHADLDVSFSVVTKLPKIPANSPRVRLLTSHPGRNFSPKRQAEIEIFGYDFADILPDGVTIDSVMWSSEVYEGADASANAMIVSPATIDGTQVRVLIGNGVRGAAYIPTCTIRASSGEVKVLPPQGSGLLRIT